MDDQVFCFLGALVALPIVAFAAWLPYSGPRVPVFKDWREALEAWRSARSWLEKLIVAFFIVKHVKGPMAIAYMVGFAYAIASIVGAICGLDVDAIKAVGAIVRDILDFFRERRAA